MKKREDHDDRHLLLPENDGGEDDFDPFGPKAVVTLPVPKTTVGTHSDKAISNVTVMPAMRLTWHSICAKPKSMVKSEKTCTSSLKDFFGIQEIEKEKKLVPRAMILKNCFGVAYPGEVLALMGSSGAGKTTLMNILTQRNLGTVVTSGTIQINEVDVDRSTLRKLSAYVQQDDLFIGTMTVAEHLHFTAMMKMGRNYTSRERNRRVKMVINDLNLTKCANTLIGNPRRGIKGISGGERKRLAFASEIMTSPPLLFCDEPTSGLDSYMARHTVEVLKQLATKKNMTIICTIHQPSSQLFALFDRICFLADGRTAFHGSIPEAVQLWKSLGDPVPEKSNPADHFVNTLSILTGKKYEESQRRVMKICDSYLESPVGQRVFQLTKSESGSTSSLESIWQNNDKLKEKTYQRYKATWCQQFFGLFKRSLLGNMRDPVVLHVRVFQTVVIALTMGAIYFDTQISQRTVMNVNGALFQVIMNMNFMFQFTTVHMFCDELPTFLREHQANLYRVFPYFLAKNLAEAIQYVVYPTIFATIIYWMSGFVADIGAFLIFALVCVLVTNVGISISYMMSCIFGVVAVAISVMPVLVIPLMAFGGFYINVNSLPAYFIPLKYLSYFMYGYETLVINEWSRIGKIPCPPFKKSTCFEDGHDVIEQLGFKESHFGPNIAILIVMILVFRSIAFFALWMRAKTKK